jgi:hypothetical protein
MGDAVRTPAWGPQGVAEAAIEAGARALWGARAIDRRGELDLPADRHEATGDRSLLRGLRVVDVLRSVERGYRDLGEEPRLVVHEGDRQIVARRAGGYVYVLVAVY